MANFGKQVMLSALSLVLCSTLSFQAVRSRQSQPQEKPAQTGRSYGTGDPARRPPAPSPQAPSPITFTDSTVSGVQDAYCWFGLEPPLHCPTMEPLVVRPILSRL